MAEDTERIGDSRLTFACTDGSFGYVQSETHDIEAAKAEATDGKGRVIAAEFYNHNQKVSGSYTYMSGVSGPFEQVADGTTLTCPNAGIDIYVEKASMSWQVGQFAQVTFEGYQYPSLSDS